MVVQKTHQHVIQSDFEYPTFLDIEASSLGVDSYPISVAFNSPMGNIHTHLIKPLPDWTDWDEMSAEIHGITRKELEAHGRSITYTARLLNRALEGLNVYTDAVMYDSLWLQRVYEKCNENIKFYLVNTSNLIPYTLDNEDLRQEAWSKVSGRKHTAAGDVEFNMKLFRLSRERMQPAKAG